MTDVLCPVCARREPADGLVTCSQCLGRIDDDLGRILELTRLAAGWLAPRTTAGNGTRSVPGSRPPLSVDALDAVLGHDVLPTLEHYERMWREHAHLSPYGPASAARNAALAAEQRRRGAAGPATVLGCATFLRVNLALMAETFDWDIEEMARDIRALRWGAKAQPDLGIPAITGLEMLDPDRELPGLRIPCPAAHVEADGRACGYRLRLAAEHMADDVHCPRCDTTWSGNRLVLVALNDPGVTVWAYPDVIETTLGIPTRTLRQWATDGHIRRHGSRYDVGAAFRRRTAA